MLHKHDHNECTKESSPLNILVFTQQVILVLNKRVKKKSHFSHMNNTSNVWFQITAFTDGALEPMSFQL